MRASSQDQDAEEVYSLAAAPDMPAAVVLVATSAA